MHRRALQLALATSLIAGNIYLQARGLASLAYCLLVALFERPLIAAPPCAALPLPPRAVAAPESTQAARALVPSASPALPATPPAAPWRSEPARLDTPRDWIGRVRFVPDLQQGEVRGVRVLGVARGSMLDLLGLQNGDRLEAINGHSLSTPASALAAYAALTRTSDFELQLVRSEAPLKLVYHVR